MSYVERPDEYIVVWDVVDAGEVVAAFTTKERAEEFKDKLIEEELDSYDTVEDEVTQAYLDNIDKYFDVIEDRVYI